MDGPMWHGNNLKEARKDIRWGKRFTWFRLFQKGFSVPAGFSRRGTCRNMRTFPYTRTCAVRNSRFDPEGVASL
jgi:hypothetical protein